MKHKGFTLAEVLIALATIGIITAITLPMINKFRPDTTKVLYLETYDALLSGITDIAVNKDIYPTIDNSLNIYEDYPFMNYQGVTYSGSNITGGRNKLCRVLAKSFNILEDADAIALDTSNACNDTYKSYSTSTNTPFVTSFTNKNGVEFMVSTNASYPINASPASNSYTTEIVIDTNGSDDDNGPNCVYNASSCNQPDRFTFKVSAEGEVRATDAVGIYYIETRTNYSIKDIDITTEINNILTKNKAAFKSFVIPNNNTGI